VSFRVLAVVLLSAGLAGAGGQEPPERETAGRGRRAPREEAFRAIDAYIVSNLQESLALTDEQFVKLLPLVRRLQGDRRAFVQRRHQSLAELRRLLASGAATEPQVTALLGRIKAAEAEEPGVLRKDRDAIDAVLSPVQQAKFRVLELEVDRKIREAVRQMRRGRRGPGRRQRPGEPPPRP
jgi:Spy/CpxP family protein refolding chaperone